MQAIYILNLNMTNCSINFICFSNHFLVELRTTVVQLFPSNWFLQHSLYCQIFRYILRISQKIYLIHGSMLFSFLCRISFGNFELCTVNKVMLPIYLSNLAQFVSIG